MFEYFSMTSGNGFGFCESVLSTTELVEYREPANLNVFIGSPFPSAPAAPPKKHKKHKRQNRALQHFNRHSNVRAGKLANAVRACESQQRGRGFNVTDKYWEGRHTYKVVTRNYGTGVEEVFWFHVF